MLRSVALRPWPPIAAAEDAEDIASSLAIAGTDIAGTDIAGTDIAGTSPGPISPGPISPGHRRDIASSLAIAGTDIAGTSPGPISPGHRRDRGTPPNRCSPKIPLKYGPGAIASVNDSLLYNALNLGILRPNKPAA